MDTYGSHLDPHCHTCICGYATIAIKRHTFLMITILKIAMGGGVI